MILQKYFAALLSIAIVVLSALLAIPSGRIDAGAAVQLVSVGVAAIVTYLTPLVNISWKGILKTGAAVIAAIISILYPIAYMHGIPTGTQIALMVLAALNALGVEMGVQIRTDTSELLVNPPASSLSTHDLVTIANATADANAAAVSSAVTNAIATAPSLVTSTAPTTWVNVDPKTTALPEAEPETAADAVTAEEPIVPAAESVDESLNPANRADDTTSINAANLVFE